MGTAEILIAAIARAAKHWPLLFIPLVGQLLHELTHFAVARAHGVRALIRIRLRTPMKVVYDDSGLSYRAEVAIGLAPTLIGLTAACAWLLGRGWPPASPLAVAAGLAWALYTIPSGEDMSGVGPWLAPEGQDSFDEPLRSMLIGLAALAAASWVGLLPLSYRVSVLISLSIATGAMAYLMTAFYRHGFPEGDGSAIQ